MDAGDLLFQRVVGHRPSTRRPESFRIGCGNWGADALANVVNGLERDELEPTPQPKTGVTQGGPRLEKEDGRIDWARGAVSVCNLVRGTNPFPGAFTTWRGETLKVHTERRTPPAGAGMPGAGGRGGRQDGMCGGRRRRSRRA